ncbi:MAG: hypothetical protein R3B45_06495 [Bdellovibrionota bacterium]
MSKGSLYGFILPVLLMTSSCKTSTTSRTLSNNSLTQLPIPEYNCDASQGLEEQEGTLNYTWVPDKSDNLVKYYYVKNGDVTTYLTPYIASQDSLNEELIQLANPHIKACGSYDEQGEYIPDELKHENSQYMNLVNLLGTGGEETATNQDCNEENGLEEQAGELNYKDFDGKRYYFLRNNTRITYLTPNNKSEEAL